MFYRYQVAREIRMHSQLLHENIVRLYCAWKDSQFIHVAEEYAPHGDIYSLLKPRNAMAAVGVAENFVVTKVRQPKLPSQTHANVLVHVANPTSAAFYHMALYSEECDCSA